MNAAMKERGGKASDSGKEAIAMLTADHKKVKGLFADFETSKSGKDTGEKRSAMVIGIYQELTEHAELEWLAFTGS